MEEKKITFDDVLNTEGGIDWDFIDEDEVQIEIPEESTTTTSGEEKPPVTQTESSESDDDWSEEMHTEVITEEVVVEEGSKEEGTTEGISEEDDELASYIGKEWESKNLLYIPEGLEIKSETDLETAITATVQKGIDEYKSTFTNETTKNFIQFVEKGGNPAEFMQVISESSYEDFSKIETDEEKLGIIKEMYTAQDIKGVRADRLLAAVEDEGDVETEFTNAKEYFEKTKKERETALIEIQTRKENDAQNAQQVKLDSIKSMIKDVETVRDFPLTTEKAKKDLESYIFDRTIKYTDEKGTSYMITKYQKDKFERSQTKESEIEDILFDALLTMKGTAPIQKLGVTKHTKKFQDIAKRHKNKSTSSKLQSTGKITPKTGETSKISFDSADWD